MSSKELKMKLKELINHFNEVNNSCPDRIVSQIEWKNIHKELLKLKPCLIEKLETEENNLSVILETINEKAESEETLSEIENITGNYITFIYHVEATFLNCVGIEINKKSEEELELEELDIYI